MRHYRIRQWAIVSPHVEPVAVESTEDGSVAVHVIQTVFDLNGQPLDGQTHRFKDKTVTHIFRMKDEKIVHFDIQEA